MTIQMCPIDIPEGWEFERVGIIQSGDRYITMDGNIGKAAMSDGSCNAPRIIIRPALQVGDWVRVNKRGFAFSGSVGRIEAITERGKVRVVFDRNCDGLYCRGNLVKQTRTVEPYDLSECIAASTRLDTLGVRAGRCETVIESFHIAGVTVANQDIGFVSYVEAARSLVWRGGEAFGIERWEDAK